ncbi:hypothetical protein [Marinobacter shengliensis]|uniref:hypothetical protein n=1 Tax=Marinobacter shengliensis TaxID=1389223 RepID=UPI000D102503|nr:hypothetical protein [Marinobacter shengliensis]PSF11693.1 hypothetical protein C7H10_18460 [Marinobacter shengliensis]
MIEVIPKLSISTSDIKILRRISSLGISEIKEASAEGRAIRRFEIFGSEWETERMKLVEVYNLYASNSDTPFYILDTESDKPKKISPAELSNKIKFWREIELETQMNSDLENGYINNPSEFEPHDEDWA